jgi:hypothetical protein
MLAKGRIHEVLNSSVSKIVQLIVTVQVAEPIFAFSYILEKVEIFYILAFHKTEKTIEVIHVEFINLKVSFLYNHHYQVVSKVNPKL